MITETPTTANAVVTSTKEKDMDGHLGDDEMQTSSNVCPKCSIIKRSGELSCCARGGSWHNQCSDSSDPTFDHTWNEGIQACNNFASAAWIADQAEISREEALDYPSTNAASQHHNYVRDRDYVGAVDSTEYLSVSKTFVCTILFFVSGR